MSACPACGHDNEAEALRCTHCGRGLALPATFAPVVQPTPTDKLKQWLRHQFRDLPQPRKPRDKRHLALWALFMVGLLLALRYLLPFFFVP